MKTYRLYQANDVYLDISAMSQNEAVLLAWRQGFGNVAYSVILEN